MWVIASEEERLQKWKEYFKNLLGKPLETTDKSTEEIIICQVDDGQFTEKNLDTVLEIVKSRKIKQNPS